MKFVVPGLIEPEIVLSKEPTATERFAAEELQRYLQVISGIRLEVVQSGRTKKTGVLIGRMAIESNNILTKELALLAEDGFVVRIGKNRVYLSGNNDRGTLYSIYCFLEMLKCRWFAPMFPFYGDVGAEYVPKMEMIDLEETKVVQQPSMRYRKKYVEEGKTHNTENLLNMIDWMAKNRLNVFVCPKDYQAMGTVKWDNWRETLIPELRKRSILIEVGGHGYEAYLKAEEHFDEHPEWFGVFGGERTKNPRVVFCSSNGEALQTLMDEISKYLAAHPEIDIFDLWPPDGDKWCECSECLKLGSPSERHALIVKKAAEYFRRNFPRVILEFPAYSKYLKPPEKVKMPEGLMMDFCSIRRSFNARIYDEEDERNLEYYATLLEWIETFKGIICVYSYYRKYAWRSLPIVVSNLIADEIAHYQNLGIDGMGSYSEPGDWVTYELNHLATARCSWGGEKGAREFLEEYCRSRFRDAWKEMRSYFTILEDTFPQLLLGFRPDYKSTRLNEILLKLREASELLRKAKSRVKENKGLNHLIEKLETNLEFARMDLEINRDYIQGKSKEVLRRRILKVEKLLKEHKDSGLFVIDERRLPYYRKEILKE